MAAGEKERRLRSGAAFFGIFITIVLMSTQWSSRSLRGNSSVAIVSFNKTTSFAQPHFPNAWGAEAVANLSTWMSTLYERTLLAYRETTRSRCLSSGCEEAIKQRRAEEPAGFRKYDLFDPFVSCPGGAAPQRMGGEIDGGKWLCMDLLQPPCVILSLGSNGDFSFEESMLQSTECEIHTFDCTYEGSSIHSRHSYHKKCLGSAPKAAQDGRFITLDNALKGKRIALLKIDVEGFEHDVLSAWRHSDTALPASIAMELHHSEVIYMGTSWNKSDDFSNLLWPMHELGIADLGLFFGHLAQLGYGIVSREDNTEYGTCCSEFLLVKVGDWATNSQQSTLLTAAR